MVILPSFWSGKTVLLTGHTGFKGGWMSLWLQSMNARVIGYALPPATKPSLFEMADIAKGMTSLEGDIRDFEKLLGVVGEYRPEIVFHMAAQPLVRYSYLNPVETYAVNVMGTIHVLEAVRQVGATKVFVNITSDKCYENREWVWGYRENEPMGGYDPYSSSKGCAELVTSAYRNSFFHPDDFPKHGLALASVRAGNVLGGGDWAQDRLVPDIMRSFLGGTPARIRNPHAIRPWQHVLEPLSGYLLLAQKLWEDGPAYAEGWNFGPGEEDAKPVKELVERLAHFWGTGAFWTVDTGEHPHEARFLKLDCSKARSRLNWRPRWDMETTLKAVVAWYKAYRAKEDIRAFMEHQIKTYQETERET